MGLFVEMGPFQISDDMNLILRHNTWVRNLSIIYIDNPVGTGYSFTKNGFAENQTIIAHHLYNALLQFYTLFPDVQKQDLYVSGESYGGKYGPALAYAIHQNNPEAELKMNLKGVTLGNAFSDPPNLLLFPDMLFNLGLIDAEEKRIIDSHRGNIADRVSMEYWYLASEGFLELIASTTKASGYHYFFNFLQYSDGEWIYQNFLMDNKDIRQAIHVGNVSFGDGRVYTKLFPDILKSVAPLIDELFHHYRILVYNGQLDICVAYISTVNFLQKLNYSIANGYNETVREKWYVEGKLAGYVKEVGNLTQVMVRNAGHMVPYDQLDWSYDMITKFINNESLSNIYT